MSDRLQVVVIGGGIGGLCLAQGLRKAGVPPGDSRGLFAAPRERDGTARRSNPLDTHRVLLRNARRKHEIQLPLPS